MWTFQKEAPNINSFHLVRDKEGLSGGVRVNKRALLVSGESEDFKGCTNDVIEYAVLISNVYRFKEIRILLSEESEALYGNFISLALNRIEGAVVQIVRLSRKSLKEGFKWLVSMEGDLGGEGYYPDCPGTHSMAGDHHFGGGRGFSSSSWLFDSVFVYCGPVKILKRERCVGMCGADSLEEPFIVVSRRGFDGSDLTGQSLDANYFGFSEFEGIISESSSNSRGSLTCFLDCDYSYMFLSNYTRGGSEMNLHHQRVSTMPQASKGFEDLADEMQSKLVCKNRRQASFSVLVLASCSSPKQSSQEIKVCSSNGVLGLSIIYRGLFSYCLQSVIRRVCLGVGVGVGGGGYGFPQVQGVPRIPLKYLVEEISASMFQCSVRNKLKSQVPVLLASSGVSTQEKILLAGWSQANSSSKEVMASETSKHGGGGGGVPVSSPVVHFSGATGCDALPSSYNVLNPSSFPAKNLSLGNKRIYTHQGGVVRDIGQYGLALGGGNYVHQMSNVPNMHPHPHSNSNLIQEINQLKSELCFLKQSINSENMARDFSQNYLTQTSNRMNVHHQAYSSSSSSPVQIFNSDTTIFRKSVKPSSVVHHHNRTLTSK